MNVLTDAQRRRILDLLRSGKTLRRIEEITGHRRETIAAYGRRAGLIDGAVIPLDAREEASSMYDAHAERIAAALGRGRSLREIHAALAADYAITGSYSALKRFVRVRSIGASTLRACAA